MRKLVFAAVAALGGLTVALLGAELTLRMTGRPFPVPVGWAGDRPAEKNEFGFRGHPLDATTAVRVVLLGDSQVEAVNTGYADMPEKLLERSIAQASGAKIGVVSIEGSGWGQDQQLLALQAHIETIHPAAVVLWFTEGNDLWNNTFPTHFPKDGWPKPTFWLEGDTLTGPNVPWLGLYRPRGLYLMQAIRRVRGLPNYPLDADWEPRLPPPYHAVPAPPGTPNLASVLAERNQVRVDQLPYFSAENFETEKTHYSIYLVPQSARLRYAARLTRALLQRVERLCQEHGARFFVLTTERWNTNNIPEAPTLFEFGGKGYTLSNASARRLIDGVLEGLPVIRVTGVPPDAVVSRTDIHWNADGNRYVMERVAQELMRSLPDLN